MTAAAVLAEKLEASRQELRHAVAAIGPRPGPEVRACLEDQERAIRRIKVGIDKH